MPALGSAICPAPRSSPVKVLPSLRTLKSESTLTVKSKLHDGSSEDDLRKWVVAVALGRFVHVDSGFGSVERLRPTAALNRDVNMRFTPTFANRYPELAKITTAIAKGAGSKWCVSSSAPGASSRTAKEIDSPASFARLLKSIGKVRC